MPRQEIATRTIPFNKIEMKMIISIRIVIMCKKSKSLGGHQIMILKGKRV